MPAKSPEALERKRLKRMAKDRTKAAAAKSARPAVLVGTGRKWHIGPKMPEMSKADLRDMLAQAMANTAALPL